MSQGPAILPQIALATPQPEEGGRILPTIAASDSSNQIHIELSDSTALPTKELQLTSSPATGEPIHVPHDLAISSPSQPLPRVAVVRVGEGLSGMIHARLPDPKSRFIGYITFGLAFALSVLWIVWIVDTRWVSQIHNPSTVLTRERQTSVPLLDVFVVSWTPNAFGSDGENVVFKEVVPVFSSQGNKNIVSSQLLQCPEIHFYQQNSVCQPYLDGNPLFIADSDPGPRYSYADWPLAFTNTGDTLLLNINVLLNMTKAIQPNRTTLDYVVPVVQIFLLPHEQLIIMKNILAEVDPAIGPTPDQLQAFDNILPRGKFLELNHFHEIQITLVKTVFVDKSFKFDWTIGLVDTIQASTDQVESRWNQFVYNPDLNRTDEMKSWLTTTRNLPNINYYTTQVAIAPISLVVQVVTEQVNYGYLPFLSDLGGFLNLLTFTFAILFPFAHAFIRPRLFITFYIWNKWNRWRGHETQEEQDARLEAYQQTEIPNGDSIKARSKSEARRWTTEENKSDGLVHRKETNRAHQRLEEANDADPFQQRTNSTSTTL